MGIQRGNLVLLSQDSNGKFDKPVVCKIKDMYPPQGRHDPRWMDDRIIEVESILGGGYVRMSWCAPFELELLPNET